MQIESRYSARMDANGFERLTEGQKECLRLFHARFEVKDIARQIDRSPVTVHQRLAAARKHLGVDRSVEAARLLVDYEAGGGGAHREEPERLKEPTANEKAEELASGLEGPPEPDTARLRTPAIPPSSPAGSPEVYSQPIYDPSMMGGQPPDRAVAAAEKSSSQALSLPFPTRDRPVNDMSFGAKLLYVVVLAALIALVFGGMVAALTGLSELF